jgi:predicted RNase H-like nuclease (RuvC/YqgF family)
MLRRGPASYAGTIAQRIKTTDNMVEQLRAQVRSLTAENATQARQLARLKIQLSASMRKPEGS